MAAVHHIDGLDATQRALLVRIAGGQLIWRSEGLVWRGGAAVTAAENELLRCLWRGGFISVPSGFGEGAVTLEYDGWRVVEELMVFGEPPVWDPGRDLLEDLDRVLGAEPVPLDDVPALLSQLAPEWGPYQGMTGSSLRAELDRLGAPVQVSHGRHVVNPVAVRSAGS